MRGYLQRLALGVMQPAGTIHPMVGSVFLPHQHTGAHEALPPEETVFSSSGPKSHSQEDSADTSIAGRRKSVVPPVEEPNRLRDPEPIYKPLLNKGETPQLHSPGAQGTNGQTENLPRPAEEKTSFSHFGREAKPERVQEPGRDQGLVVKHIYAPMMSESTGRDPRQVNSSRSSGTTSREPDEIQIHIGRIEVTAVQQTSAPAVVKPARRGLSLDEYLRRANGRAR